MQERRKKEGVKVYNLYARYPERWRAYRGLYNPQTLGAVKKLLLKEQPAVIHAHNAHCYLSYHCFKIAHDLKIPVVLTMHDAMSFDYGKFTQFIDPHDLSPYPEFNYTINPCRTLKTYRFRYFPLRNCIIKWYLHHYVTTIIAVCNELKKALLANGISCSVAVHNGIELQEFQGAASKIADFKNANGLINKKVILFAGRLSFLKGGEQIIRAMQDVCARVKNAVLLVAGRAEGYARHMEKLAEAAGIRDHILFTGWISGEELKSAYAASDLVVCPSICWDSFPTVNLEAMAMKKPVIATCFGGSKELVVDGVTGYIVNPFNTALLAEKITELLTDDNKARQMGEAGYRRISEGFAIHAQAQKMLTVLAAAVRTRQH